MKMTKINYQFQEKLMKTMSDAYKYGFTRDIADNTYMPWKNKIMRLIARLKVKI